MINRLSQIITIINDNRANIKLFGIALATTLFFGGYLQDMLINCCIFGYLAFNTITMLKLYNIDPTMEFIQTGAVLQMQNLLKHWTCFSALITVEYFVSALLTSFIYNLFKVIGLILLLQNDNNLITLYDLTLVPLFNMYEQNVTLFFKTLEFEAQSFKQTDDNPINYDIYQYIAPHVNKVKSFMSTIKVEKK